MDRKKKKKAAQLRREYKLFGMCGSCPSLAGSMERGELSGRIGLGSEVEAEEGAKKGRGGGDAQRAPLGPLTVRT